METDLGRTTIVICPNCGEDNAASFRFCGMCGTPLEARRPAGAPRIAGAPEPARAAQAPSSEPSRSQFPARTESPVFGSGASLLGLDQTSEAREVTPPSIDTLRDRSFSGLDSFFEPEEPKTGGRRVVLLIVLLIALGVAGWWAYSNYIEIGAKRNPSVPSSAPTPAADTSSSGPTKAAAPPEAPPAAETKTATSTPPADSPAVREETPNSSPAAPPKVQERASVPAKPAVKPIPPPGKKAAIADASPAPASTDTGDAAFKKGEAYLYGRGVPENCDEAIKNLKAASAKQHAKARSTFGTMYATGHCVPRDLPTSYSWFAQALRVDPNNQILEKDLVAVWNQMTPPERQAATRAKQ